MACIRVIAPRPYKVDYTTIGNPKHPTNLSLSALKCDVPSRPWVRILYQAARKRYRNCTSTFSVAKSSIFRVSVESTCFSIDSRSYRLCWVLFGIQSGPCGNWSRPGNSPSKLSLKVGKLADHGGACGGTFSGDLFLLVFRPDF